MFKVFLSSTGEDLTEYRAAAHNAINSMDGFHCDAMEQWGARATTAVDFDHQRIGEADLVIFIIGHRYGSSPVGAIKSYTELEYDSAQNLRRPCLFFFAGDTFPIFPQWIEDDNRRRRQIEFRLRIKNGYNAPIVKTFDPNPNSLAKEIIHGLVNWLPNDVQV